MTYPYGGICRVLFNSLIPKLGSVKMWEKNENRKLKGKVMKKLQGQIFDPPFHFQLDFYSKSEKPNQYMSEAF